MSLFDDPRRYFLAISLAQGVADDYEENGRGSANVETNEFSRWMPSSHYREESEKMMHVPGSHGLRLNAVSPIILRF